MPILHRSLERSEPILLAQENPAAAPASVAIGRIESEGWTASTVAPAGGAFSDLELVASVVGAGEAGFAAYARLAQGSCRAARAGVLLLTPGTVDSPEAVLACEGLDEERDALILRLCRAVAETGERAAHRELGQLRHGPAARKGSPARSFLGVPIRATGGATQGCLWVVDTVERDWPVEAVLQLTDLATLMERELGLRVASTERRTLENLVRTLGKAVENMQLGVTVTDLDGKIIYTNPAEARMHGYEVRELVGTHARILGMPESGRPLEANDLRRTASWTRETVNVRKDGSRFPVLLWSDHVTDTVGRSLGIVTCSEDVTERKRAEDALREVALRDSLTALPNRAYFLERLTEAITAHRADPRAAFAVLFLDLDRFKVVNDSLGHHVGDELLRVVATRLRACIKPGDTVARFGGDEFAVLLERIPGIGEATALAQTVQTALNSPIQLHGYELFTSASIGIVLGSAAIDQPEYLWRSADMAMYRAKGRGTGLFEIFDHAMHAEALARLQMETDLRRAVEREEFELHYQPVVQLETGRVAGFEALLRWHHPIRGLVAPADVIPVAEETGLIAPLGEWVLREACRQLSRWRQELRGCEELWVGVNLSSKQLAQPQIVERVRSAVLEAGIAPRQLKLEITESAIVENTEAATETMRQLKSFGVQVYLDDFGTGYSSLSYLHQLPLDALKIDRSFVSRMVPRGKHSLLVQTVLELARNLGLEVVAEGVEVQEQLEQLREFQCGMVQGFLLSRPLPAGEVEAFLEAMPCAG